MFDGMVSLLVLLDFSAVFDTIDHNQERLESVGDKGMDFSWLRYYVSDPETFYPDALLLVGVSSSIATQVAHMLKVLVTQLHFFDNIVQCMFGSSKGLFSMSSFTLFYRKFVLLLITPLLQFID